MDFIKTTSDPVINKMMDSGYSWAESNVRLLSGTTKYDGAAGIASANSGVVRAYKSHIYTY